MEFNAMAQWRKDAGEGEAKPLVRIRIYGILLTLARIRLGGISIRIPAFAGMTG